MEHFWPMRPNEPNKTEEEFFHNSFLRLIKEEKECYRFLLIFHQKSLSFKQKENKSVSYSEIHSIIIGRWHKMTYKFFYNLGLSSHFIELYRTVRPEIF